MKRCLITYEPFEGDGDYSVSGLKLLDRNVTSLAPLSYTAAEQRQEALERAGKMSIQGVQLKLSAVLRVKAGAFDVVDRNGRVHGFENVFVGDGSVHVTNGGFNPVLTIFALAFRLGAYIRTGA